MKIIDVIQQSDEWFKLRKGKISGSHAQAIGNCGKGLDTYIIETMSEYFSSGEKERFSNQHTDRGNELEAQARAIYELETGSKVEQVGLVEYNDYVVCSPDGLVGEDGGIEIKCVDDKSYLKLLLDGETDTSYIWQIQMNMLITERKWFDLVIYNPNFEKSISIYRLLPNQEMREKLLKGFNIAEEKIKLIIIKMKNL